MAYQSRWLIVLERLRSSCCVGEDRQVSLDNQIIKIPGTGEEKKKQKVRDRKDKKIRKIDEIDFVRVRIHTQTATLNVNLTLILKTYPPNLLTSVVAKYPVSESERPFAFLDCLRTLLTTLDKLAIFTVISKDNRCV